MVLAPLGWARRMIRGSSTSLQWTIAASSRSLALSNSIPPDASVRRMWTIRPRGRA